MQQIYLDNASTTFPKPQTVADAVYQYITHAGTNISRGTCAASSEDLVLPPASNFAVFRRRGQQKCCLDEEHYRKPEYHHQRTAAQRRPCACYRNGAQRRHASAPANRHRAYDLQRSHRRHHLQPHPLRRKWCTAFRRFTAACAPQHQGYHHDARQQCLRHAAALGGNRQLLPKA